MNNTSKNTFWVRASIAVCAAMVLTLKFSAGYSQVRVFTIQPQEAKTKQNSAHRVQALPPMSLPFFDDFSDPFVDTSGIRYADVNRWENSYSVWINPGLGIKSPTVNVATFDGLDSAGAAYNAIDLFANGYTDSLVSRRINLTESASNPVSVAERNSVFLSFFYQWKGNGEVPDSRDYLEVQFKNNQNAWVTQATLRVDEALVTDDFHFHIVQVSGDAFFHENFQFRFRSFGRLSGPYDTWNVDYVYLNKGRTIGDVSFPDRAAASTLSPLFGPYYAMPYYHFQHQRTLTPVRFDVKNLKDVESSTNYTASITSQAYDNDQVISTTNQTLVGSKGVGDGGSGALSPFVRVTTVITDLPDPNDAQLFDPSADSVDLTIKATVISADEQDTKRIPFEPYDLRVNDTVSQTYSLKNYYAYDDGVAEYAVGLINSGDVIAYKFTLPPNLHDTLKVLEGFEIYFPPFGLTSTITVDFLIFQDNNGVPQGEGFFIIPSRALQNNGVNGFQRIRFFPELQIDRESFYIGWRQPISGRVLVGLDNSNDTGAGIFSNLEGSVVPKDQFWEQNTTIKGSLMIRPIFGTGEVDVNSGIGDEPAFDLYPNPSQGKFTIEGLVDDPQITSVTGTTVALYVERTNGRTLIEMVGARPGLYVLRYRQGAIMRTEKIMVLH